MFRHHRFGRLCTLLVLVGLLAACGGSTSPTAAPATVAPTATTVAAVPPTAVPPTEEPSGEATEEPSDEATEEPSDEATEEPSDEATEEPSDEATAAPVGSEIGIGASNTEASFDTTGEYIADFGFRPDFNGFSFENYGGGQGATDLTPTELRRMFGDQVCATLEGDVCILTPAGEQWMESTNSAMNGGHCEGLNVLSNLFYTNRVDPTQFGGDSAAELDIVGNEALQREIAYWWATQMTMPARAGWVAQSPSGVINTLMNAFAAGPEGSETYGIGFFKRDGTGGHAVTPYAVEDRGDGIYWIMIYDNNYPRAARAIEVDTNADTWTYNGSTNPAEPADNYEGDAQTLSLFLTAIEPRLTTQICPFCDGAETGGAAPGLGGMASPLQQGDEISETDELSEAADLGEYAFNEVWLEGDANLLITDAEGRRLGFADGQFVNEIPGTDTSAKLFQLEVWNNTDEPVYYIPADIDFTIEIDGSQLTEPTTSTVTFIGPGYVLEVSDIYLDPGQVDILDIAPDGSFLSYRTTTGETPLMLVGVETDEADYLFMVQGYEMAEDEAVTLSLNTEEGWLSLDSIDNVDSALYSLYVAKYDDEGETVFGGDDIELQPNDVIYVDYLKWGGNGQPMELDVDRGADDSIDESLQIEDISDELVETEEEYEEEDK